ncbi:MAG: cupin domain-containing protein [Cyclobacteriaceae bacterium]
MSLTPEVKSIVDRLELKSHPEGGFYREVFRSKGTAQITFENNEAVTRDFATSIYFLLTSDKFSAFHKIKQDEIWHFYQGSPITIHMLSESLGYYSKTIGQLSHENEPQFVVPANTWFATEVNSSNSYALVGCGVSPGFSFDDFELANRADLLKEFQDHEGVITRLTRQ